MQKCFQNHKRKSNKTSDVESFCTKSTTHHLRCNTRTILRIITRLKTWWKKGKGFVLFKLNINRCWDKLFTNKKIMSSIVLLNKEAKTLCLFLFSASNFKSRSYQVHHVKATSIKTIRKMVTFTTRVQNYLHHLESHKMPSISLFPRSLFYLNRLGAKRRLLWWGRTCSWNFHGSRCNSKGTLQWIHLELILFVTA